MIKLGKIWLKFAGKSDRYARESEEKKVGFCRTRYFQLSCRLPPISPLLHCSDFSPIFQCTHFLFNCFLIQLSPKVALLSVCLSVPLGSLQNTPAKYQLLPLPLNIKRGGNLGSKCHCEADFFLYFLIETHNSLSSSSIFFSQYFLIETHTSLSSKIVW